MNQQLELAQKRLFGAGTLDAKNIKLYPGSNRDTGPEQFAEEINKSISRISAGEREIIDLEKVEY